MVVDVGYRCIALCQPEVTEWSESVNKKRVGKIK